ncbi:hypothetical protein BT67DRAFT_226796 [Trichocladium antarcticum]|uniref:Uncharacterized protein n=1 Tax=Trichocladium antarcticum TaxID=1450529 RepID=A0AAN6UC75_9PEZI|nr:hypothetical protein BT67DRAFT_226796 [Trichocladium antarcticum]
MHLFFSTALAVRTSFLRPSENLTRRPTTRHDVLLFDPSKGLLDEPLSQPGHKRMPRLSTTGAAASVQPLDPEVSDHDDGGEDWDTDGPSRRGDGGAVAAVEQHLRQRPPTPSSTDRHPERIPAITLRQHRAVYRPARGGMVLLLAYPRRVVVAFR